MLRCTGDSQGRREKDAGGLKPLCNLDLGNENKRRGAGDSRRRIEKDTGGLSPAYSTIGKSRWALEIIALGSRG